MCCCRRSCLDCSLASAGNICWAKPNHGLFHCQQPVANFFPPASACAPARVRRIARATTSQTRASHSMRALATSRMQATTRPAACMTQHAACATQAANHASPHAHACIATRRAHAPSCMRGANVCASHKSECAKNARTFFATRIHFRIACARFAPGKTRNPRRFRRGFRMPSAGNQAVSGLRLPAVPRSRQAPAVR